jgi:hypothetical protein
MSVTEQQNAHHLRSIAIVWLEWMSINLGGFLTREDYGLMANY